MQPGQPITDPELLKFLNGAAPQAAPAPGQAITDPALLEFLNAPQSAPAAPAAPADMPVNELELGPVKVEDGVRVQYVGDGFGPKLADSNLPSHAGEQLKGVTNALAEDILAYLLKARKGGLIGPQARSVARGVTVGGYDDAVATATAMAKGTPVGEEIKKQQEQRKSDAAALGPTMNFAGEAVGGAPAGAVVGKIAARMAPIGSSVWQRMRAAFAAGAAPTAIHHWNTQDGTYDERSIVDAAIAGTMGGSIAAVPVAAPAVYDKGKEYGQKVLMPHVERWRENRALKKAGYDINKVNPLFVAQTRARAAEDIARGATELGIDAQDIAAGANAKRLHNEGSVPLAIAHPTLGRMALHAGAGVKSGTFGKQGNFLEEFKHNSLHDPVDRFPTGEPKSHAQMVKERVLGSRDPSLPQKKEDYIHGIQQEHTAQAAAIEAAVSQGRSRVNGIQALMDNDPRLLNQWIEVSERMRIDPDVRTIMVRNANGQMEERLALRPPTPDTVNLRVLQKLRDRGSHWSQEKDPVLQDEGHYIHNALSQRSAAGARRSRAMESAYDVKEDLHKREAAIQAGHEAVGASDRSTNIAKFRDMPQPYKEDHAVGSMYRLADNIDDAAAKGREGGLADDLFGTPHKREQMAELLPVHGSSAADHQLIGEVNENLQKIGARRGFVEKLEKYITEGKPDTEDRLQLWAKITRAFSFSSSVGGAAAAVQYIAGPGASKLRQKAMLDILLDESGMGEALVRTGFARQVARARAAGRPVATQSLSRAAIKNMLITEIIGEGEK